MPKRGKRMAGGETSAESSVLPPMYNISDIASRGSFQYRFTSSCEDVRCTPCITVNTSAVTFTPSKTLLLSTASTLVETMAISQSVTSPQTTMDGGGTIFQSTDHAIEVTAYPTAVTGISTGTPTKFNITGNSEIINADSNKTTTSTKSSSIGTSTTPYITDFSSVATKTPPTIHDSSSTQFSIFTPTTKFSTHLIKSTINTSSLLTRRSTLAQSVITGIVSHAISTMTSPTLQTPPLLTPCKRIHPLPVRPPKPYHPSAQVLKVSGKTDLRAVSPFEDHRKGTCTRNYQSPVILLRHHHKPKEIPRSQRKLAQFLKSHQLPPVVQPRPQKSLKPLKHCQKSNPHANVHQPQHQQLQCHKSLESGYKIPHKKHSVVTKSNPKEMHGSQHYKKPPILHRKIQTPPRSNDQISQCLRPHTPIPTQSGQQQRTSTPQQTTSSTSTSHLEFTTTYSAGNTMLSKTPVSVIDITQLTMSTTAVILPLLTMNPLIHTSSSMIGKHFSTQSVISRLVSETLSTITSFIFSTYPPTTPCRKNYPLPARPPKHHQPSTYVLNPLEKIGLRQIYPSRDYLKATCSRKYQSPAILLRNHHKPSKSPRFHQNPASNLKPHQHPSASQPTSQRPLPPLRLCQKSKLPSRIHMLQYLPLKCQKSLDSVNNNHCIVQATAAKSNQKEMPGPRHYKKPPITHQKSLAPPRTNHHISFCSSPHIPSTTQSGHQPQTPTPQQRTILTTITQSELTESNSTSNITLLEPSVTSLGNPWMTTTPNALLIPSSATPIIINSVSHTNGNTETFLSNHMTQHFSSVDNSRYTINTTLPLTASVTETSTHPLASTSGTSISGQPAAIVTNLLLPITTCLSIFCPVCNLSEPDTSPTNIPPEISTMGYTRENPFSPVRTTMNSTSTFSEPNSSETMSIYHTGMTTSPKSSSTAMVSSIQSEVTFMISSPATDPVTENLPG